MKKLLVLFLVSIMLSCTGVDSGHSGAGVSYGGAVDQDQIYEEGLHYGLRWIVDHMEEYDVREKTFRKKFLFNDSKNMLTGVEVAVDYSLDPKKVNLFHSKIGKKDFEIKLEKTIASAAKEVIPQYSASELNLSKRAEAEEKLNNILSKEFKAYYVNFARIQLTDVDIPEAIAQAAELTAKQEELNKLSASKVADSKNKLDAAEYDARANALLSQPAMLKLKELEIEMEYAKKGVSKYGSNNVFGASTGILLNR